MTKPYVFLSYSRNDGDDHVSVLEQKIPQSCGLNVWRDIRGIDPAQDFGAELEKAIEGASHVVVCLTEDTKRDNSFVRREIGYSLAIKKPIYVARFHDIIPHLALVNHTYVDFFENVDDPDLGTLCEWFSRPSDAYQVPDTAIDDPYRPYLKNLLKMVIGFLNAAVIRDIELDIQERPDQVPDAKPRQTNNALAGQLMPWMQANIPAPQLEAFSTFGEAFRAYEERVVLLGDPGAGKTITLLNQLREAINARLEDADAPLPLYGIIARWNAVKRQPFAEWLSNDDLSALQVEQALAQDNTILFLDGLDELGRHGEEKIKDDEGKEISQSFDPRQRFIEVFKKLEQPHAVVSCRVEDYAEIGEQIPLNGAVQLEPLSDEQIANYLTELPELLAAVNADPELKSMLRTPLLMSLFAFAFRDELTPDQRQKLTDMANTDAETLRDQIILLYLERRYLWEQSKGLPMPFAYDEWLQALKQLALRNLSELNLLHETEIFYNDPTKAPQLNVLKIHHLNQIILDDKIDMFWAFTSRLNVMAAIGADRYRFQHILLLNTLAWQAAMQIKRATDPNLRRTAIGVMTKTRSKRAVEFLLDSLQNDSVPWVRVKSILGLGDLKDTRAVEPLLVALSDSNDRVRAGVAQALGELKDARAVEPLINALSDEDWNVQAKAAWALGDLGDSAVEPLINALSDEDSNVRVVAALALGRLGESAFEPLLAALNADDKEVRAGAARALGDLKDARAVEPLINALSNERSNVRARVAQALGELKDARAVEPLINALSDEEWNVRAEATWALGNLKDTRAVEPLLVALSDSNDRVRASSARALGNLKDARAVEPLIDALSDEGIFVLIEAAGALGNLGESAFEPLLAALSNEDSKVRVGATRALGNLKDAKAVEPLINALVDEDSKVRVGAAQALGNLGESAVEPLVHALSNEDSKVRVGAAWALGDLKDGRAVEPLINALSDQDSNVREGAVQALGNLKDGRAVEPLINALRDENRKVRAGAAEALGNLKDARAVDPLIHALSDQNWQVPYRAAKALGNLGESAVEPLLAALNADDKEVRAGAAKALGNLKDARAIEPLIATLSDAVESVAYEGAKALDELGWTPQTPEQQEAYDKAKNSAPWD